MTSRGLIIRFFIFLGLLLISVGFNIYLGLKGSPWHRAEQAAFGFNPDIYQAVFLDNSQVYFGRITSENEFYLVLTDIYYLQNYSLQEQSKSALLNPNDLVLVKLGREMHQPKDEMVISRQHILFVEELAGESRVLKAIREYSQ